MTANEEPSKELPANSLRLIDDDLALALAQFGTRHKQWQEGAFLAKLLGCLLVAAAVADATHVNIWPVLLVMWGAGSLYAMILARTTFVSFRKNQIDKTAATLDRACAWSSFFYPISAYPMYLVSYVQYQMLMNQGRFVELEALTRMVWASKFRRPVHKGIPQHDGIAYTLGCAYIGQRRYPEAIEVFSDLAKRRDRLYYYPVVVLALCHVRMGQSDVAERLLDENADRIKKPPKAMANRIHLIRATAEKDRGQFEDAERRLEELIAAQNDKSKESNEFAAACYRVYADLRFKEKRVEEAELHYRNAIDCYKRSPSPDCLNLAETLREYAGMLSLAHRGKASAAAIAEAEQFEHAFVEREQRRLDHIRAHLDDKHPLYGISSLVNVGDFRPYQEIGEVGSITDSTTTDEGN